MSQIFERVRVIDLTQGMAGPLATMILADYGAEVIRVEPPGGDPMWAHSAYLLWNRGKKSVDIDWSSETGRTQARQLLQGADIFIESLRPGEAGRLGLGYDDAKGGNAALIYYSLSAFGQEGPYKDLKAYDGIINAKSGRMRDQVGWQRGRPTFRAVNDVSYHAAMFTVQAIIAALRVRLMTGRGQKLEGSLLTGVTAPNNAWRRFEGQQLAPDRYPAKYPRKQRAGASWSPIGKSPILTRRVPTSCAHNARMGGGSCIHTPSRTCSMSGSIRSVSAGSGRIRVIATRPGLPIRRIASRSICRSSND